MWQVSLKEGRNLPVWGLPWQSNPWCTLRLGGQVGAHAALAECTVCFLLLSPKWRKSSLDLRVACSMHLGCKLN